MRRGRREGTGSEGFTLVELLVAGAAGLIVLVTATSTFGFLAESQAKASISQSSADSVRVAVDQLQRDLQEANPLEPYSSASTYPNSVQMALGPTNGSQTYVQWKLDTTDGSPTRGTLFRQVLSAPSGSVLSSYPEIENVQDARDGESLFRYFGQGGEDLVADNAPASQVAACSVRVDVVLDVAPGSNLSEITQDDNVAILNRTPGAMPCG